MGNAKTASDIAAEAYQVIGAIAGAAGLFDHPDVQRALDYFADPKGEVLPFALSAECTQGNSND